MAQLIQKQSLCPRKQLQRVTKQRNTTARPLLRSGTAAKASSGEGNKKLQQKQKEKKAPQKKTEEELMEEKMRALDNEVTLYAFTTLALAIVTLWQVKEMANELATYF